MKRAHVMASLAVVAWLIAAPLHAQVQTSLQKTKLAENLYEFSTVGGAYPEKVVVSVGADGLLLVDSGPAETAPALADALRAFGKGLPRIVINTHSHIEHIAGNPLLAKDAVIVGHANLRERYVNGLYYFGTFPPAALPNLTFTDSLPLHFNGEEIRLASFAGAHDDSDIAVWFTRSKVVVVGALCMGNHFPSIDGDTSDMRKYPEVTARLLAWVPEDVRLVPGHAEDCDTSQARRFLEMLTRTRDLVRAGMAEGKGLSRLQADDVLKDYASWESGYVTRNEVVEYWYSAFTTPPPLDRKKPFAPVVTAFKEKGAKAAVDVYSELRRTRPDDYWFEDTALMWMGRRLFRRMNRPDDARVFLERCIQEYPGSEGAAASHAVLAGIFEQQGDLASAKSHLSLYLQKHPEDTAARTRLDEMGRRPKK
jgi:glyoxylase-like metal-dependent hydrolase (beta-lactamase superfamily II)